LAERKAMTAKKDKKNDTKRHKSKVPTPTPSTLYPTPYILHPTTQPLNPSTLIPQLKP